MTKREQRVINAFLNCIRHGEYSADYAVTLIEDNARYGWLTDDAKDEFYFGLAAIEMTQAEPEPAEPIIAEPEPFEEQPEPDEPEADEEEVEPEGEPAEE